MTKVFDRSSAGERHFGLLSVYSQIGQLGGDTDFYSRPGRGTVGTLMLPLRTEVYAHDE